MRNTLPPPRLADRDLRPEWMDGPDLDPQAHARALRGLKRINALSFTVATLLREIEKIAPVRRGRAIRVLDLACGGGDTAIGLARRAKRRRIELEVEGCDLNPGAVELASRNAAEQMAPARFYVHDALGAPFPERYDVVTCSLFLHHLKEEDAVTVLSRMKDAAARLVVVDDLIRSAFGYALAWAGCRILSRSPIVHYDGPVSVGGAFRIEEVARLAKAAGLEGATIRTRWPERFLLACTPHEA